MASDSQENINFEGLEQLLRKSFNDEALEVIDYKASNLIPVGENYGSVLFKLDVDIRKSGKVEILHLVAKTPAAAGNSMLDWPLVFKKEVFMYSKIHPLYRQLEKQDGIEEDELINAWPKYIGHRNSLKDDEKIDENSVMLMENIKFDGFYTASRKKGLDLEHSSKALSVLARFHALGIVMKQRRPKFLLKAVEQAEVVGVLLDFIDGGFDAILEIISKTPCMQKYLSVIESSFKSAKKGGIYKTLPSEPWDTITHGDFWANNILFHKNKTGDIDDAKFLDFQLYRYASPTVDLIYFFIGSLDVTTKADHLQELIDLYYNSFIETLNRMNYDTSAFTRESFDAELKKSAIKQLPLCTLAMKFFAFEVDEDTSDKSNLELGNAILEVDASDLFQKKLKELVQMYEKMGWF